MFFIHYIRYSRKNIHFSPCIYIHIYIYVYIYIYIYAGWPAITFFKNNYNSRTIQGNFRKIQVLKLLEVGKEKCKARTSQKYLKIIRLVPDIA